MTTDRSLVRSGNPVVDTLESAGTLKFKSYRVTPSAQPKSAAALDDPLPLFLSSTDHDAQPGLDQEAGYGKPKWPAAATLTRAAVLLAAAAAALALVMVSVDTRVIFANAKASFAGVPAQPAAQPKPAVPKPAVQLAAAIEPARNLPASVLNAQASIEVESLPIAAASMPTREEIAAAFKNALQNQNEVHQPAAAAPPTRQLDADELASLLKRARSLIASGDIATARLFLERAADAREASAALLLAQTYDPAVLGTPDARSITLDPATARAWYQKAAQFGSREAQQRLDQKPN